MGQTKAKETSKETDLAYSQNIINIETLEQRPHGEIHINQTATKVKTAGEARHNF